MAMFRVLAPSSALKMEEVCFSETLVPTYKSTGATAQQIAMESQ
jgi:hypothetical protein